MIKSYPDTVYLNYYSLGLSLVFGPKNGYKPTTGLTRAQLDNENLKLESIDVYNIPKVKGAASGAASGAAKFSKRSELAFACYPQLPITIEMVYNNPEIGPVRMPASFDVDADKTGKDFVNAFGEPDRKGGGSGPSSGSIGIWCEWTHRAGILVEFGGIEARGPQAWEKGKDSVWKVMTLFTPGKSLGTCK